LRTQVGIIGAGPAGLLLSQKNGPQSGPFLCCQKQAD
jgi:hypothetical protein